MKLIDKLVERSLLTSRRFVHAVRQVHDLALSMEYLARQVHHMAMHVRHHEHVLRQIVEFHNSMMQHAQENSMDLNLASKKKKIEGADKPN